MDQRYEVGIWLGVNERNSEIFVSTNAGVVGARSIKRMPPEDKWDRDMVQGIKGVPWNLSGSEHNIDVSFDNKIVDPAAPLEVPQIAVPIPRRVRIGKADLQEHGFSEGCPGCEASKQGRTPRGHSEPCRVRLLEALRGSETGQKRIGEAIERLFEHVANAGPRDTPATVSEQPVAVGGQGSSDDQNVSNNTDVVPDTPMDGPAPAPAPKPVAEDIAVRQSGHSQMSDRLRVQAKAIAAGQSMRPSRRIP